MKATMMEQEPKLLAPLSIKLEDNGICVHEPYEPEKGWVVFAVPAKGVYVRVCQKCRVLYADIRFPTELTEQ